MLKLLIILTIFISPTYALAEACGQAGISIHGATLTEEKAACASVEKVAAYFREIGAEVKHPWINFYFKKQVVLPSKDPLNVVPVHGYFDTDDHSIHMTNFDSESQAARMPWGFVWSEAMATSFLLHEISHLFAVSYMGQDFGLLDRHWHEFLAYGLQIELMEANLKQRLIQFSGGATAYGAPRELSSFHYEADPELFALRAYFSLEAWGQKKFVKDLMDLKIPESKKIIPLN